MFQWHANSFHFHFLFPLSHNLFMNRKNSGSPRIWSQAMFRWSALIANLKQRSVWCKLSWREGAVEVVELFCFYLINLYFFDFVLLFLWICIYLSLYFFELLFVYLWICICISLNLYLYLFEFAFVFLWTCIFISLNLYLCLFEFVFVFLSIWFYISLDLYCCEGGGVHQLSWPGFLLLVEASKHSWETVTA